MNLRLVLSKPVQDMLLLPNKFQNIKSMLELVQVMDF